ncbi:hypothetical protein ACWGHD_04730 [Streptomyces xanthophaeus]
MNRPKTLIEFGQRATAEGCPIEQCDRGLEPFITDQEAVEHISGHSIADMAWTLLEQKAVIHELSDLVREDDAEDLMKGIGAAAAVSRREAR